MTGTAAEYETLSQSVHDLTVNIPSGNLLFGSPSIPAAGGATGESIEAMVSLLRADCVQHLNRAAARAFTINETGFFRDAKAFEALRTNIIPALIARNAKQRTLRIWSAATSTGQEAYSLAMLLLDYFPELLDWDVVITATDQSANVVHYANAGCYRRSEVNGGLPARLLLRYFKRRADEWIVCSELRALCSFGTANLCEPLPPMPVFDLILMRNVLLHLPHSARGPVFDRLYQQVSPRGYLMLGNAEQAEDFTERFEPEYAADHCFYRPAF